MGLSFQVASLRMISASAGTLGGETQFQLERAVTSLLRLGVRLARKEELASIVVQSLRIFLPISGFILRVYEQVAYGLHKPLGNNAANIHRRKDKCCECLGNLALSCSCVMKTENPPKLTQLIIQS